MAMERFNKNVDEVAPPKTRQEYWDKVTDFTTKYPLASSFLITQAIFSGGPLIVFVSVSVSTLLFTVATALVTTAGVVGTALFAVTPVLFFTVSAATLTWIGVVTTYVTLTWIYNSLYQNSYVDHRIQDFTHQASKTKQQIDQNGSKEFNGYLSSAEDLGNEAKENVEKGYAQLQETGRDVRDNVQKSLQPARDKANAAYNATSDTVNGVKNDLMKDDGVIDGLNAKKDRAAKTVADKTK